ncbi:hypothetical protein C4J81_07000 [Deltaproteobacteria bacterium Smac51]|nr:hypothetical protein C4J81_07000 [Deltaproteobacteria bacterium Smac51]
MSENYTIVCDFDASSAKTSLPLAAKMAQDRGARLVLVNVVSNRVWYLYSLTFFDAKREQAEAFEKVEPMVREIMSRTPEVEWELRVVVGDRKLMLAAITEEVNADLLVSARRHGKIKTLKTFDKKAVPVPETTAPRFSFTSVGLAADSSCRAVASLSQARPCAAAPGRHA